MTCREIPLSQGKVAIVDEADYESLASFKWYATRKNLTFYAQRNVRLPDGRWSLTMMHRVIMDPPVGLIVDHINQDGLDNRRANMRLCTQSENSQNTSSRSGSSSPFLGVSWNTRVSKWLAVIRVGGRPRHLGFYVDEADAARAYDAAALEHFGEFASPNFPRPTHTHGT